jgi:hypothetical protein
MALTISFGTALDAQESLVRDYLNRVETYRYMLSHLGEETAGYWRVSAQHRADSINELARALRRYRSGEDCVGRVS